MGFPINLPSGKGMTINYMLCKYSFELFFFWRKSGTVVVVGVPDVFFALSKKCDRKKQQQGGCAEAGIKTVQAPLRQAQRPLG